MSVIHFTNASDLARIAYVAVCAKATSSIGEREGGALIEAMANLSMENTRTYNDKYGEHEMPVSAETIKKAYDRVMFRDEVAGTEQVKRASYDFQSLMYNCDLKTRESLEAAFLVQGSLLAKITSRL